MNTKKTMSAGGVILNQDGLIAIVNQKHLSWSLPKGHVEENEEIFDAAIREVREETGITQLTLVKPLDTYSRYAMNHENGDNKQELKTLHFFLFTTTQTELKPSDKDNPEALWVKPSEIEGYLTHPEDKKFIKAVIENHLHEL